MNQKKTKIPVVFIAFLEQDNLGIGYISSMLLAHNIQIKIVDFRLGENRILQVIKNVSPEIIGFSIIFQYHILQFKRLVEFLRRNNVTCHFNAGGHFPSLRYNELLTLLPQLNSVTLFEGEHTFLELVQSILQNKEWRNIKGLAFNENGKVQTNTLRPLEPDIDSFPPPVRQPLREYALGKKYATILAGRGCYYNCSFCSIREFYSKPEGPLKRIRKPEMVVREMELLFHQKNCTVFMFQDDDFPVASPKAKNWIETFCSLLHKNNLAENIAWKINCRPDEVNKDLFDTMKNAGLFLVYLGIENGTDAGLQLMNKHIKASKNIQAVQILNQLDLKFDFGFMLFHPESTFQSVRENLTFLDTICGDGTSPVTYCKMLPYAATKIETLLKKEGRLKGETGFEDYDFKHPALDRYYRFSIGCFEEWLSSHEGVLNVARWARYYMAVYEKFFQPDKKTAELKNALKQTISKSNRYLTSQMAELLKLFETNEINSNRAELPEKFKENIKNKQLFFKNKLIGLTNEINCLAENVTSVSGS